MEAIFNVEVWFERQKCEVDISKIFVHYNRFHQILAICIDADAGIININIYFLNIWIYM